MPDSTTPNYGWSYPTVGADSTTWGSTLNTTIIAIDAEVHTVQTSAQPVNALLTSLGALSGTSGTIPYFSAANTFGQLSVGSGLGISAGALNAAVTSVATRTGAITLSTSDISGLGSAATHGLPPGAGSTDTIPSLDSATNGQFVVFTSAGGRQGASGYNASSFLPSTTTLTSLGGGSIATRNYTSGTAAPSGGISGDLYGQHA